MKVKSIITVLLLMAVCASTCLITSCSNFNRGGVENKSEEETETANEDITTSNGSKIQAIDDRNFYVGCVKYTIESDHLIVSGYFPGVETEVTIYSKITFNNHTYQVFEIGEKAFENFKSLTSVNIPKSVKTIAKDAFNNCWSLTSVTIPNSVTSIGNEAFANCYHLTSIAIGSSVISIGNYAFLNCSKLTSITIPNSVTTIGNNAFSGCTSLTSITIPNSVTSIGEFTFYKCYHLTSITIPESVKSIGKYAFEGCTDLKSVKAMRREPAELGYEVFTYERRQLDAKLYVPKGCKAAYQAASGWEDFKEIIEMDE